MSRARKSTASAPPPPTEEPADNEAVAALAAILAPVVALWVERFRDERWSLARVIDECHRYAEVVASQGDVLQFCDADSSKKEKAVYQEALEAAGKGLAACSFAPGGVTFGGLHFETNPETLRQVFVVRRDEPR